MKISPACTDLLGIHHRELSLPFQRWSVEHMMHVPFIKFFAYSSAQLPSLAMS